MTRFSYWFEGQENLRTILLDSKNHVIKVHTVYIGSLNSASVRVGELFSRGATGACRSPGLVRNKVSRLTTEAALVARAS